MTTITATQVRELREQTGAGMMECKNALVACQGDKEKAIEHLRKRGQAKADTKASRIAAEGSLRIKKSADNRHAVMIEVNCETDFVAKDESFRQFADMVVDAALTANVQDISALAALPLAANQGQSVEETRKALIAKIGENINLRRMAAATAEQGALGAYLHGDRIGVLVTLQGGDEELAKDIAMHIAASRPRVIAPNDVASDLLAKEKEIYMAQAAGSGKPAEIIEKMVAGRLKKFVEEVSLLGQPYIKDPNVTVADLLKKANAQVLSFTRFEVAEGIEKETTDFVAEVLAQARK